MTDWAGRFGVAYTQRNPRTTEDMDALYVSRYGCSRSEMNDCALGTFPADTSLLEVGCNVGTQLRILRDGLGFTDLMGCDVNRRAVSEGRRLCGPGIELVTADASRLPFADAAFDVVFTSGLLIHIHPDHLPAVMDEMVRVSRRWVWGFEYHAAAMTDIPYRDGVGCWKGPYHTMLAERHGMRIADLMVYPYRSDPSLVDCMYLLDKEGVEDE